MKLKRYTPAKVVPVLNFRRRAETGIFWNVSMSVRQDMVAPVEVDQTITALLSRPPELMSDWLRGQLMELRNLNKKRFKKTT